MMMSKQKHTVGQRGEAAAAQYLETRGYRIIARNWRCRSGEIDLIAQLDGTLVIVEVRSRTGNRMGTAVESVDWRKQKKIRTLAQIYQHLTGSHQQTVRFDVIAIQWQADESIGEIEHITNAF